MKRMYVWEKLWRIEYETKTSESQAHVCNRML